MTAHISFQVIAFVYVHYMRAMPREARRGPLSLWN